MVPLSNAAMSVLSALPRPEDNPWVTSPPRTAVRISPVSRSLGAASAPWPGSTTFESMTIATPLHPGPWLWAEAFPMIGKLLGHSDIETTARYAHLAQDSIHETAERIAQSISADIM